MCSIVDGNEMYMYAQSLRDTHLRLSILVLCRKILTGRLGVALVWNIGCSYIILFGGVIKSSCSLSLSNLRYY